MKKFCKLITLFGFSILLFFSTGSISQASPSDWGTYIKVGLKHGTSAEREYIVKAQEGFLLGRASADGFDEGMPLPAYTTIHIRAERGTVILEDEDGTLLSSDLGSSGVIMPADYADESVISLNNVSYRGGLMFLANANGTITAINYLPLEHYVYGVLNGELHHTNPKEALKAQAVAARSFGLLNIGTHSSSGFDVCTTTHCQVYKGYSDEFPATNQATDETRGEMLRYNGKTVTGFYFKNSGGHTQNVEDVWSYRHGYLIGVKDTYSPSYPWTATISFSSLKQKLEAAGYQPGTIESVSIKSTNATGNVSDLEIVGSNGTINLKKENIRYVLGATLIKSTLFTLNGEGPTAGGSSIMIHNGNSLSTPSGDVYALGADGNVTKKSLQQAYVRNGEKTAELKAPSVQTGQAVTGDQAVFNGYGYGHGVGMPQDSAIEMAKKGYSYIEILKQYYTGIEIR